jgi:hypothetical protein
MAGQSDNCADSYEVRPRKDKRVVDPISDALLKSLVDQATLG